jgi:preprotein translocase subunit SecG
VAQNPLTLILLINSIFPIGLILNQNENTKDAVISGQNSISSSSSNPLEQITWFALALQFILLLIRTKVTDF